MKRKELAKKLALFGTIIISFVLSSEESLASNIHLSVEQVNEAVKSNWEKMFSLVRDDIRFVPSPGIIKTAEGVLWSRAGNSAEQALLLGEMLVLSGHEIRYAMGILNDEMAIRLIESAFAKGKKFIYPKTVTLSNPLHDPKLLSQVKQHYWVQLWQNDVWIDLDPCFPLANMGKAYANSSRTFSEFDTENLPTVQIVLQVEQGEFSANGIRHCTRDTVFSWKGSLKALANQPVSLNIVGIAQTVEEEETGGRGAGGVFGAFGRSVAGKTKARREIRYFARLATGNVEAAKGEFTEEDQAGKDVTAVWLEFEINNVQTGNTSLKRVLFEKRAQDDKLASVQRHAILITGNKIPDSFLRAEINKIYDEKWRHEITQGITKIKDRLKREELEKSDLSEGLLLEANLGARVGHLANLAFASLSDTLSDELGRALAVLNYYEQPRIIVTSFLGTINEQQVFMDLRQNNIQAIAYPGQAVGMEKSFCYGRGILSVILEGELIELLTGQRSLSAAHLLRTSAKSGVPIRMYSPLERNAVVLMNLPDHVAAKTLAVLDSNNILILPDAPYKFIGEKRWAWWSVDSQTWETVGYLDTGLRQGLVEITILEEKGPMSTDMAQVLGVIVGIVDTQWLIAAKILEYGELNERALQEAKAYMKQIGSYLCPGLDATEGIKIEVVSIEDCYSKDLGIEIGIKINQGWCQKFTKGFKCASTTLLNFYLTEY
jgi:hypothetical protein